MIADKERKNKEFGVKIYKLFLHIITIGGLILLYRSLYITHDDFAIFWGLLILHFLLRFRHLSKLELKAQEKGMKITEYLEEIKKINKK